eukprot:1617451-Pyramimonas_sp.AAC.1
MVQHGPTIVQHSPCITTTEALQFEETTVGDYFYDNATVRRLLQVLESGFLLRDLGTPTSGLARYQSTTGSVLEHHYGSTTARVLYYDFNATTTAIQYQSITTVLATTKALWLADATILLECCSRGLLLLHYYSATTRANAR